VPVTFDRSRIPGVIRLEGEIDIASARALKEALLDALTAAGESRISLAAVTGVDATAVELLWAAEREAKAAGIALALEGPVPKTLRDAVREAGFERFPLDDPGAGRASVNEVQ
jgi:anti-anti-sigma factor